MEKKPMLSRITQQYLDTYERILQNMIRQMREVTRTDSISHNFIVRMIPHHQAAIEMSQNLLQYTTNLPLQDIALRIISTQTQGIARMRDILRTCSALGNSRQDLRRYEQSLSAIMQVMFSNMQHARVANDINCNFMWEMIPHHQGAAAMARTALQYPICPELKPVLQSIIATQQQGIMQMQQLQRRMRCPAC